VSSVVLVPGSFEGSWTFDQVAQGLSQLGHEAYALTLPGLESDWSRSPRRPPNLDDHISHVVQFIQERNLTETVVCAHSYGGMVLRGVCDHVPGQIAGAVYVDAVVPQYGESCWSLLGDLTRELFTTLVGGDGRYLVPPPTADRRSLPHPIASLMQASKAPSELPESVRHAYIYASGWAEHSPFRTVYEKLRIDFDWETFVLPVGHDLTRVQPKALADLISRILSSWAVGSTLAGVASVQPAHHQPTVEVL